MSNGGSGWPPAGAGGFGHDGRYSDDEFGSDRDYEGGDPRRYGGEAGYGDQSGRGRGRRAGRHSSSPSYDDPYGQDSYGAGGYGQEYDGWQGRDGYADPPGRDDYERGGYGQGPYGQADYGGSYQDPGYGGGYGQDSYARGSYGQDSYGRDGYGGDYGQPPPADPYGRDPYAQEGYGGPAGSYRDPGGYPAPEGYGSENGYTSPGRPARLALGSGADQDVASGYRPDTGSFDSRDSGWFSQPTDTGSFGSPAGNDGPPHGFGPESARGGGYGQWHEGADDADGWDRDEPADHEDDWQDDPESGLLSRRFGGRDDGGDRHSGRRSGRSRRPRRLRGKFAVTAAVLAGALVLGAVTDYGYERYAAWHKSRYGDYTGAGSGQVRFLVPQGAALSSLGPALMKAGVIEELRPFDSAAAAATNAAHLQPGVYLMHQHMSSALAVQYLLSSAHRTKDQVTIIEGTRASAIAAVLSKQTGDPASQFTQIIYHPPAALGLPSWAKGKTAEGFLFPDTYTLLPKTTPLQILQTMVTEFKQKVAGINLVGEASRVGTSPWHALIVASMIQAEAGSPRDFGKISRVVWNRLLANMPLQFDSTVFYAMGKYGTYLKTAAERNFPSPYNTYLHTGLPPGPIGNPGIATLQAAVHATHGNWLYFIADTRHKPYKTYFTASQTLFEQWQHEFEG